MNEIDQKKGGDEVIIRIQIIPVKKYRMMYHLFLNHFFFIFQKQGRNLCYWRPFWFL